MVNVLRILVTMALVALASIFNPTCAFACSCRPPGPPAEALASATAVFSGRVTAVSGAVDSGGSDPVQATFAVTRVWKGADQPTVVVATPASSASCGVAFAQGQEYLVYASDVEGRLQTVACSRTAPIAAAGEDLAALGAGSAPSPVDEAGPPTTLPATGGDTLHTFGQPAVMATGALMLIALGAVLVSGSRRSAPVLATRTRRRRPLRARACERQVER
jgi:hypothetical protein